MLRKRQMACQSILLRQKKLEVGSGEASSQAEVQHGHICKVRGEKRSREARRDRQAWLRWLRLFKPRRIGSWQMKKFSPHDVYLKTKSDPV